MANQQLFASTRGLAPATVRNAAGGSAYALTPQQALAQIALTGTLRPTFYAGAELQLAQLLEAAAACTPTYVAQTAIYARRHGHMKDVPAVLLGWLATADGALFERVFAEVVDNGRMLRNLVQVLRSGALGRRSLGTRPKRCVQQWLNAASDAQLVQAMVGQSPSLADVIKMVHPKAPNAARAALYGWLIGKPADVSQLPAAVQDLLRFRADPTAPVPDVPFQLLTAQPLSAAHWSRIAERASWQTLRMNLNTFGRHGVYEDAAQVRKLATRLADPQAIAKARVLPYQLLAAHHAASDVPEPLKAALATAMDQACANVPVLTGEVVVAVDVSGSMSSPVTGWQKGASSAVRCIDVAALIAACLLKVNPSTRVIAFNDSAWAWTPGPAVAGNRQRREGRTLGVLEVAAALAGLLGGGTAVSTPFALLDRQAQAPDVLVLVSDNMSWVDSGPAHAPTETWRLWQRLKQRNRNARLVCIDLQPNTTAQVPERADVLTIGGFTDEVYARIADFVAGGDGVAARVRQIEAVPI